MAIHTEKTSKIVKQTTNSITSITCDCCGKEIPLNENDDFVVFEVDCGHVIYDCCSRECALNKVKQEMEMMDFKTFISIRKLKYELGQKY